MDFSLSDDLVELKERTERLVRERIIPYENDPRQTPHGPSPELRRELVALGRGAGLLSPHVGREWGGLGLDHRAKSVVFEAAGYSPLGPVALNCFAPDEANMHLLEQIAERAPKGALAAATGGRRDPLVLHDDRAGARRGVGPVDAENDSAPRHGRQSRRLCYRRRQMVDHRRCRCGIRNRHGEDRQRRGRSGGGHNVPHADGRAGYRRRARARHARPVHVGRPCGDPARRAAGAGKCGARPGGRGFPLCPGAARAGAADPLHALARRRPARPRRRRRLCPPPHRLRQAIGRARRGRFHARRQRDGFAHEPAGDLARRMGARPGRARAATN